jgi:hypothetical protein
LRSEHPDPCTQGCCVYAAHSLQLQACCMCMPLHMGLHSLVGGCQPRHHPPQPLTAGNFLHPPTFTHAGCSRSWACRRTFLRRASARASCPCGR